MRLGLWLSCSSTVICGDCALLIAQTIRGGEVHILMQRWRKRATTCCSITGGSQLKTVR